MVFFFFFFLHTESPEPVVKCTTGRRTKLPAPKPSTEDLSLWNLMKRNIGKDLSKVSMPVVLNEPIGKEKQKTIIAHPPLSWLRET